MACERLKIGIVGGTGYTGVELLRLLAQHPQAERARDHVAQGSRHAASRDMFPSLRGRYDLAFTDPAEADLAQCDVVFFATPHGVAMAQARELVGAGVQDHRPRGRLPPRRTRRCSSAGTRCRTPAPTCSPRRSTGCPR